MKLYQLAYLLSPDLNEQEVKDTSRMIENTLREAGGDIERTDEPSRRELGYPVAGKQWALLGSLVATLAPEQLEGIRQKMAAEKQILRLMLVKLPTTKARTRPVRTPERAKWAPKKETKVELTEIEKKLGELLGE